MKWGYSFKDNAIAKIKLMPAIVFSPPDLEEISKSNYLLGGLKSNIIYPST